MRFSSARILSSTLVAVVFFVTDKSNLSAADSPFSCDVMAMLSKAGCNLGTSHGNQRANLEDVAWSLMSSPEFVLRH